jgi:hypothetical protein
VALFGPYFFDFGTVLTIAVSLIQTNSVIAGGKWGLGVCESVETCEKFGKNREEGVEWQWN